MVPTLQGPFQVKSKDLVVVKLLNEYWHRVSITKICLLGIKSIFRNKKEKKFREGNKRNKLLKTFL